MKTQIIFTCSRCGKEQIENLNCFTVRRFKYRNLIGKDIRGYKLDKEICPGRKNFVMTVTVHLKYGLAMEMNIKSLLMKIIH